MQTSEDSQIPIPLATRPIYRKRIIGNTGLIRPRLPPPVNPNRSNGANSVEFRKWPKYVFAFNNLDHLYAIECGKMTWIIINNNPFIYAYNYFSIYRRDLRGILQDEIQRESILLQQLHSKLSDQLEALSIEEEVLLKMLDSSRDFRDFQQPQVDNLVLNLKENEGEDMDLGGFEFVDNIVSITVY